MEDTSYFGLSILLTTGFDKHLPKAFWIKTSSELILSKLNLIFLIASSNDNKLDFCIKLSGLSTRFMNKFYVRYNHFSVNTFTHIINS